MSVIQVDSTDPRIVTITLNRPEKRNALSLELIEALRNAVADASNDPGHRVLILRGAGPSFCAGLDLSEAATGDAHRSANALKNLYEMICLCPLITIAAAQGAAMAGGAGLLAACDLAVVAEDVRIAFPEVRRGLVAALVTCLIRRQLGDRTARELILLGRTVEAHEAHSIGLVNRVVQRSRLELASLELAKQACLGAPGAIARTKQLLDDLSPRQIVTELNKALQFHLEARNSEEAAEGIKAFLEKRAPHWAPTKSHDGS